MLRLGARLAGPRCLLLCLLPAVLRAQPGWEGRPKPLPCQQSPTKVSCKGAGLHRFPEELGQGVKYLELSNNFIRNLSESRMRGFGQLEHLDVCFNQLEAVSGAALAQLPQLRSLLLGSNRLDRNYLANGRAFGLLSNIEVLDLSANNLESHMAGRYLSSLSTLKKLDLSGNRMTRLPAGIFWSTPRLSELNLSNNYIMEIEEGAFGALEELEVVNLAFNSLHCISGFSLGQLRVLNLSHNALELFVSEEGEEPYLLQVLDLSHNRLLYFPELPRAHYLTHLNLSNNLIASLAPSSRHPAAFALPYDELARFNGSSSTAAGLTRVADLDLSNNQLQLFPFAFFHGLSSLHNLSVAMNCLQDVTRETLTGGTEGDSVATSQENVSLSVRSLDLHDNLIRALPRWFFDFLPQLETIDLGSNSLQPCESQGGDRGGTSGGGRHGAGPCTAFYNVPHLKHLSLSRNNITRLQPYAFNQTSLLSLDLSENTGLSLPKAALGGLELSLQELWLRGNGMGDGTTELPCLGALKALDLSGNRLSLLPAGLFCSPLESLDVRDNNLPALAKLAVASWARSLRVLWVAGNPFSCCGLGWLDTLRAARVRLPDLERALCAYPHRRGNFSAPLSSHPWWPCPRPKGAPAALVVVLSILLCLGYGACCLLRRGHKPPGCGALRGSRVGGFVPRPKTEKAAKERPADGDTKV
uniref:Leucine rich repeat containing 32 n=1 Tax=Anser brachyrhynchus TaxID=132585 RepID=A0A8B9BBF0_9AVES